MSWHAPDFDAAGWETAAQLFGRHSQLWAICEARDCHHSREILAELVEREPDLPISAYTINHRLRCTACGARQATMRAIPGGEGTMQRG